MAERMIETSAGRQEERAKADVKGARETRRWERERGRQGEIQCCQGIGHGKTQK